MYTIQSRIQKELDDIKANGLFKNERIITSPQGAEIKVNGVTVLNFCANNYLGLSSHPKVIEAAKMLNNVDQRIDELVDFDFGVFPTETDA